MILDSDKNLTRAAHALLSRYSTYRTIRDLLGRVGHISEFLELRASLSGTDGFIRIPTLGRNMKQSEFESIMAELESLQDEAMESREKENDDSPQALYFNGKDLGLAEAKNVLRRHAVTDSDERGSGE